VAERVVMATRCAVHLAVPDGADPARLEAAASEALEVLASVEAACTRFRPDSPLMRANRTPDAWHRVPPVLLEAVAEAKRAHDRTGGRVDPRVLRTLVALGYDRTLSFGHGPVDLAPVDRAAPRGCRGHGGAFRPGIRRATGEVRLGPEPIDLGGIGKGLAVRWAAATLGRTTSDFLVDAGGDLACRGGPRGGGPWLVGVEDPTGPDRATEPLAVLGLRDRAVATSSIRLRRWRAGARAVHHLIDPRTGRPGGEGLLAVTVVGRDPAVAESWSKALFVAGRRHLGRLARRRGLAALWVDEDGKVATTREIEGYLEWRRH
jgi:thiamine biosynthesis lipoprotein